jgi:hypothetical protein
LIFKVKGLPKNLDNFTNTCMILTQTRAIGLLLNSHTVKHANCYGFSHYFLKILFINHAYKIQTKQGNYLNFLGKLLQKLVISDKCDFVVIDICTFDLDILTKVILE